MAFRLSVRSRARLVGVHPDLVKVVERAIVVTDVDFSVVEGVRTLATQKRYFELGKSKTMHSRHLDGHAVDLAPWIAGAINWTDPTGFTSVARAMKQAAREFAIPLEWGFDLWQWDMPHFQLPRSTYP